MGNGPTRPDDDDPSALRAQFFTLRRRYYDAVPVSARNRREVSELQAMATWALRSGMGGWAVVREGAVKITNRAFDALNRDSMIGPGWHELRPSEGTPADDDGHGRPLVDVAVFEVQRLQELGQAVRRRMYSRGPQVVELILESGPLGGESGPLVLVNVRDVSEAAHAAARLAELSERLREREQIARAGELAVEVGHDLGNLVGALSARLMVLEAEGKLDAGTLAALKGIVEAQAALVGRLKAVARRQHEEQLQHVRLLEDVVSPAVQMLDSTLQQPTRGRSVRVRVDPQVGQLPPVLALRDGLLNVVMNLILNARDAMPQGGLLWFRGEAQPGSVMLAIEDQGSGIPEEILPRIFDPFFSTKGDRGTGMGLAMARQLMRRLGGDISARNRPEGGARFELRFPGGDPGVVQDRGTDPGPGGGNGT